MDDPSCGVPVVSANIRVPAARVSPGGGYDDNNNGAHKPPRVGRFVGPGGVVKPLATAGLSGVFREAAKSDANDVRRRGEGAGGGGNDWAVHAGHVHTQLRDQRAALGNTHNSLNSHRVLHYAIFRFKAKKEAPRGLYPTTG